MAVKTAPAPTKAGKRTKDSATAIRTASGATGISITLDNSINQSAPNREALRAIYNNSDPARLLGSFIAAPVVDMLAGFVGLPELQPTGDGMGESLQVLRESIDENMTALMQAQRFALRDGKAYVLFGYELPDGPLYAKGEKGSIVARVILAEQMKVLADPVSGNIVYAVLGETITWMNERNETETATLNTTWTPETITRKIGEAKKSVPDYLPLGVFPNEWGFVPVVEFINEPETYGTEGVSELERVEPFIKLYHEVLAAAAKGSKIHSTPKLALILEDKANFLKANFPEVLEAIKVGGVRPRVDLTGRELLVLGEKDKAAYVESANPIGAAIELLHIIFYCMVITSQTPEFALGVHMSSSYASTAEQTPVWSLKVQRKQSQFTSAWHLLGRIILAMNAKVTGKRVPSYGVKVIWPVPDTRDKATIAKQQYDTVQAVLSAVDGMLMSDKAAIETLRKVFPAMSSYEGGEGSVSEIAEIRRTAIERQSLANEQAPAAAEKFDIEATIAEIQKQSEVRQ